MPFCPMCGSEYEAGVERCADCDGVLAANMPHEEEDTEQELTPEPLDRLVQIASFNYLVEADLCRTRLESEGIECFLADELGTYVPFRVPVEVRLQVRESDAQRALEILQQEPQEETDSTEDADREDIHGPCCPRCGSPDISSQKRSPTLIFMSLLLLGIPLLFMRKRWDCRGCWHTWKAY